MIILEYLVFIGVAIVVLILAKVLSWPFKKILKLGLNIIVGFLLILVINTFFYKYGIAIPFNYITSIVTGILGVPGVILLVIFNFIF